MITAREIRTWLAELPDDTFIAIDDLYLVVWTPEHGNLSLERGNPSLCVGFYPIGMASGARTARVAELEARVAEMTAALAQYGQHRDLCPTNPYEGQTTGAWACTCGLDAALDAARRT